MLWFAHFHYPALDTPEAAFDVAHLKTANQRTLSERALYARAKTAHDYIEVYRAKLDKDLAQRLFCRRHSAASGGGRRCCQSSS